MMVESGVVLVEEFPSAESMLAPRILSPRSASAGSHEIIGGNKGS